MSESLPHHPWWSYVQEDLQELLIQSVLLIEIFEHEDKLPVKENFHDYSFVVFPAAKAYEGYLKKLLRDLEFITEDDYYGKRFRIGKALNPSLDRKRFEGESVYDKIKNYCKGEKLAEILWNAWKDGRNMLFHWFPNEKNVISFPEARAMVEQILDAMDKAFEGCKINAIPDDK